MRAGRIDGSTRFDSSAHECGGAVTWTATPAFAGTTSPGVPAVVQLSADRKRIARFMAVWIPHCQGGTGLDPPQDAIGFDQRHLGRLSSGGRFASHRAATTLQTTAEVRVVRETVSGRIAGTKLEGAFRTTIKLARVYRCASKSVRFALPS